jgi:alpha-L-fucosidase 2
MKIAIRVFLSALLTLFPGLNCGRTGPLTPSAADLVFEKLPGSWDEGIPLGNGLVGALVWQNGRRLRLSLDRADLWDLRPMESLDTAEWKFRWVCEQWRKGDYRTVQEKFDRPYDTNPAPTKIPAGALEFNLDGFGEVKAVRLFVKNATCLVTWEGGASLETFVQAVKPVGWFRFKGVDGNFQPLLMAPAYQKDKDSGDTSPVTGQDLRRLGYEQGRVVTSPNLITYRQAGWGGFYYEIAVTWEETKTGEVEGVWSISSKFSDDRNDTPAGERVGEEIGRGYNANFQGHNAWWTEYWSKSMLSLPDKLLEKQWVLEQYKFGSAARRGAPPVSLQAIWTSDNGKLPPWKGDFHHDLNTQLSYWPCYSANHLEEGLGFLDWLWEMRSEFERYTRAYFETGGLNVPGVTTLTGQPMGGWIQYSFSPTIGAWLAQHFYLHWRYSLDREFLENRAYPWVKEVAVYLEDIAERGEDGRRRLPASSSPEIFDNSPRAWFAQTTNYDLALIRWLYKTAGEMAAELGRKDEAERWRTILAEWPDFAIDPEEGFLFAPGVSYHESHRHFSHLMAFHPLGLVDWSNGERDRGIIRHTLATLERYGTDRWCGYSFSWLGNLRARACDGEGAAEALRTFAACFCLPNSFHVNGDQSGTGKSKFTYRPFTLEGNFAFAAGVQEMLLQSHSGIIRVFPAVPASWRDVSFENLRAQGAFLVSARKANGKLKEVRVISEKGGRLRIRLNDRLIERDTRPGQVVVLRR